MEKFRIRISLEDLLDFLTEDKNLDMADGDTIIGTRIYSKNIEFIIGKEDE